MRRVVTIAVAVALALAATACRAPGEPPLHPDNATYRDLIRREVATASSALGSAELLLAQARAATDQKRVNGPLTTILGA